MEAIKELLEDGVHHAQHNGLSHVILEAVNINGESGDTFLERPRQTR